MGCGCGSGRRHGSRPTIGPRPARRSIPSRTPSKQQQLKTLKTQISERDSKRISLERKRRNAIARRNLGE